MQSVNVAESALLIRIARLYHDQMTPEALYEAVRGVWKVGMARAIVLNLYSPLRMASCAKSSS